MLLLQDPYRTGDDDILVSQCNSDQKSEEFRAREDAVEGVDHRRVRNNSDREANKRTKERTSERNEESEAIHYPLKGETFHRLTEFTTK